MHWCLKVLYSTTAKMNPSTFFLLVYHMHRVHFPVERIKVDIFSPLKSCVEKQKSADWASRRSTDVIPGCLAAKWTAKCAEREWTMVCCSDLCVILSILPFMKKNTLLNAIKEDMMMELQNHGFSCGLWDDFQKKLLSYLYFSMSPLQLSVIFFLRLNFYAFPFYFYVKNCFWNVKAVKK